MSLQFTEHALFRYCQRILGADMRWLTKQLNEQIGAVTKDGDHKLKDFDAYAVVRNGFVVTILTGKQLQDLKLGKKPKRFKNRTRYVPAREDW